jgi:hypothetical protein
MDLSIPKYFLLGPGASILLLEMLFPPFKAHLAGGDTIALGRSLFVAPPALEGAASVGIHWGALGIEFVVLILCMAMSYRLLSRAQPLWAEEANHE